MRLSVHHRTQFEYDTMLDYSVQRLHLTPLDFDSQKVVNWKITAPGIETALSYVDGFGNRIHLVTFSNQQGPVEITAEGLVDCTDVGGVVQGVRCAVPNAVFLRQTAATQPNAAIRKLADAVAADTPSVLDQMHNLMKEIHAKVSFEIGATHSHTTAAEAFSDGRGVCQDHTHILVGAARSIGIPSRYVTGYLVNGDGDPSTASHAWAESLVPGLGWVGFDAANSICPNDHYVRVAAGIDASGVTPIRGSRRGGENETMRVEVRVEIAQQ